MIVTVEVVSVFVVLVTDVIEDVVSVVVVVRLVWDDIVEDVVRVDVIDEVVDVTVVNDVKLVVDVKVNVVAVFVDDVSVVVVVSHELGQIPSKSVCRATFRLLPWYSTNRWHSQSMDSISARA